jgi:hypothetical protein
MFYAIFLALNDVLFEIEFYSLRLRLNQIFCLNFCIFRSDRIRDRVIVAKVFGTGIFKDTQPSIFRLDTGTVAKFVPHYILNLISMYFLFTTIIIIDRTYGLLINSEIILR